MFAGLKAFFQKPIGQALVIFLGGVLLYAFLGRPVEYIKDFVIKGNYAYLANSADGLRVLSLTDPESLIEVGFFLCSGPSASPQQYSRNFLNCTTRPNSLYVDDEWLYLTDSKLGLMVFDITDQSQPVIQEQLRLPGKPSDVVVLEGIAYIAAEKAGLRLVEIKTKQSDLPGAGKQTQLKDLESSAIKGRAIRVFTDGKYIYWTNNKSELFIINKQGKPVSSTDQPITFEDQVFDMQFREEIAFIAAGSQGLLLKKTKSDGTGFDEVGQLVVKDGSVQSVSLQGNYAYLAVANKGVVIADITNLENPKIIPPPFSGVPSPKKIVVDGNIAFLTDGLDSFFALEIGVDINNELLGKSGTPLNAKEVEPTDKLAFIAAGERGLRVLNTENQSFPQEIGFADTAGSSEAVEVLPPFAYIADRNNGLVTVNINNPYGALPIFSQVESKDARDLVVAKEDFLYLADFQEGLKIYEIKDKTTPRLLKVMEPINGEPLHPLGLTIHGDYAYLAGGPDGLHIVNIYDPQIPTRVQQLQIPGQSDAQNVAVFGFDPNLAMIPGEDPFNVDPKNSGVEVYAYLANGQFGLQIWKVTDPVNREPILIDPGPQIASLVGNALDIRIENRLAYLAYDGYGVYVLDISQPEKPQLVGARELDTVERRIVDISTRGPTIYTANLNHGMTIQNASDLTNIQQVGSYDAPSSVRNMAVQGNKVYTVDGTRGLWIYDVVDPKNAQEIDFVSIPGANSVAIDQSNAFVTAAEYGLFVVNLVSDTESQVISSMDTDGSARDIIISRSASGNRYGYLADGDGGLLVVDLRDLATPFNKASLRTPTPAIKVNLWQDYLFLSLDQNGFASVNILKPEQPVLMDILKATNYTRGSAILFPYAYIAGASEGIPIIDVSYPLGMSELTNLGSNGEWIEDISIEKNFAYVAQRNRGFLVYDVTDPAQPQQVGEWLLSASDAAMQEYTGLPEIVQVVPIWIAPGSESEDPGKLRAYVADAANGFFIVEGKKSARFKLLDNYESFGTPSLSAVVNYIRSKLAGQAEPSFKAGVAFRQIFVDLVLFGIVAYFLWLGFMAIYILPIQRFLDWENLYSRLIYYLAGRHGPLLRVREGRLNPEVEIELEERQGPGTILIDASSAVVLERRNVLGRHMNDLPLARVACGGVMFTGNRVFFVTPRFDELLRGIADLRPQVRLASDISVYTRDGIELETVVFSIFSIGEEADILQVTYAGGGNLDEKGEEPPSLIQNEGDLRVVRLVAQNDGSLKLESLNDELDDEDRREIHQSVLANLPMSPFREEQDRRNRANQLNGSPYSCDPVRVFQAVYAQAVDPRENQELDWTELPNLVAIEILRNLMADEMYDELYQPLHPTRYPIRDLRNQLRIRMRNQGVLSYQFVRLRSNEPLQVNQIYQPDELLASPVRNLSNVSVTTKILRSRGIRVRFAGFTELRPTQPDVALRFMDYWRARHEREADFTLADLELRALRLRNQWREDAQKEILDEFINILDANPNAGPALAMHVLQSLEAATTDPDIRSMMPEETIEMLRNIRNWLRIN